MIQNNEYMLSMLDDESEEFVYQMALGLIRGILLREPQENVLEDIRIVVKKLDDTIAQQRSGKKSGRKQ